VHVDDENAQGSSRLSIHPGAPFQQHGRIDREPARTIGGSVNLEAAQMANEAAATANRPQRRDLAESAGHEDGRTSWLLCRAGLHLFAIPLELVIESMRVLPINAVSGAPRSVRGLCIIRGSPVPVVDPGLLLGEQPTQACRLVTVRAGGRTIALAVEAVLGIRAIAPEASNRLPPILRDAAAETIAAIGALDDELLFFLRMARIVPQEFLDRLDDERAPT
jgi:purine-binding chemotaxis protein CheW